MMHTIMVVDDSGDVTFMLRLMLEREGYNVVEARSGKESLEKFDDAQPDFVFLDIMMPGMNGWEVCRQMKKRAHVPISMLSVRKDEKDVKKSLEYAHADAHLGKPVNVRDVLHVVSRFLKIET